MNPRKLNEVENVAAHQEKAVKWVLEQVAEIYVDGVQSCIDCNEPFLESPIEAIFLTWFHAIKAANFYLSVDFDLRQQHAIEVGGHKYRLDFIVTPGDVDRWHNAESKFGIKWPGIGVELDGHDFHEKTKEQVTHRNRRDRELTKAGWTIFHYSGSEIHNKGHECADEVFQHTWKTWVDWNLKYLNTTAKYWAQK